MKRPNYRWTPAEEAVLIALYPAGTRAEIMASLPRRTWASARGHATGAMKILRHWPDEWTAESAAYARAHYALDGGRAVAAHLGVTLTRVHRWANRQRIGAEPKGWPAAEEALLRAHYPAGMPVIELAALLGRTVNSIVAYACRHGIPRTIRSRRTSKKPPKPPKAARVLKVKAEKVAKLVAPRLRKEAARVLKVKAEKVVRAPKAAAVRLRVEVAPVATKKAPGLPNYNAQKASTKTARWKAPLATITAAYIRSLAPNHPERGPYSFGGSAEVLRFRAAEALAAK